ncbi:MAG: polysaccharide biosynthesis/export family protein [Rhizobacter sp.]|nr:polysaccharide biosynthesis/export family protein [Rhizobacter sp.]
MDEDESALMNISRASTWRRVAAMWLLNACCLGLAPAVQAEEPAVVASGMVAVAAPLTGAQPTTTPPVIDMAPATVAALTPNATEPSPYRFARGDELNLKFFYTPELNTIATVRSDGRIDIPLVGEIVVEGMSAAELSSRITSSLVSLVKRPEVSINVTGAGSQRVFVGGEVAKPGVQPLLGPLSVVQAVMVAEGLKETAKASEVVVIRRGAKGESKVIKVNLADALDGRDTAQDLLLQPYDVVVVPRSGIANVNLWVDQYLRRNLPISLGVSYSINRGGVYP